MKVFSKELSASAPKENKTFNRKEMSRRIKDTLAWTDKAASSAETGLQDILKSDLKDTVEEYAVARTGNVIVLVLKVSNPDKLYARDLANLYLAVTDKFSYELSTVEPRELERKGYNVALVVKI